jgi:hypothetical protein
MTNDLVSLIVSGGIGVVKLVAVLPAILWIDKVGRRALLRGSYPFLTLMAENLAPTGQSGGSLLMALSHFCIAVPVLHYHSTWSDHPISAWMCIVSVDSPSCIIRPSLSAHL